MYVFSMYFVEKKATDSLLFRQGSFIVFDIVFECQKAIKWKTEITQIIL